MSLPAVHAAEHEITELRRRISEVEARFLDLTENSLQGIVIQRDFKPLFANSVAARILGVSGPDQILAVDDIRLLLKLDSAADALAIHDGLTGGGLTGGMLDPFVRRRAYRVEGSTVWLQTLSTRTIWDGAPAILSTMVDVTDLVLAEQQGRGVTDRLDLAIKNTHSSVWDYDARSGKTWWSDDFYALIGLTRQDHREDLWEISVHPDDLPAIAAAQNRHFEGKEKVFAARYRIRHHRRQCWLWFESRGQAETGPDGAVMRFIGIMTDITNRIDAENASRLSEERLRLAITGTRSGVWDLDLLSGRYWCSPEFARMLGYDGRLGQTAPEAAAWEQLVHPDDLPGALAKADHHLQNQTESYQAVYRLRCANGEWLWIYDEAKAQWNSDGQPVRMTGIMRDITHQKAVEDQLSSLATQDPLTGLPNRTGVRDKLEKIIASIKSQGGGLALLMIDLDRFKLVNETMGHAAGDQMLLQVADRLQARMDPRDILARMGGDEFCVLCQSIADETGLTRIAQQVLGALAEPLDIEGKRHFVRASVGISIFGRDANDVSALLGHADSAMYTAKAAGGHGYRFFTHDMNRRAAETLDLEQSLRRSIEAGAFELHYQPKVCAASLAVTGFEALIRWPLEGRGMVSPSEFIAVAERTGLIIPLGHWCLQTACWQLAAWRAEGLVPVPVAVNISARQMGDATLPGAIRRLLDDFHLDASLLEVEVTESAMMADAEDTLPILRRIRDLGVGIAVDDFGTGYSSLAYLKRLPLTALKIDRSFVNDVHRSNDDRVIASAIIGLAQRLGLTVIAEGVEHVEQRDVLRALQCEQLQGFLFGRPVPARFARTVLSALS